MATAISRLGKCCGCSDLENDDGTGRVERFSKFNDPSNAVKTACNVTDFFMTLGHNLRQAVDFALLLNVLKHGDRAGLPQLI